MDESIIRVLLVEDHQAFRRFVRSVLEQKPELQIVYESSDGLEAVQKAAELQPDLIVLDIGLPTLNGIEAARQISKLSPKSRILFFTQHSSADMAQAAFNAGALGYVIKVHAGSELLAAAEAVCQGTRFVSKGISGHIIAGTASGPGANGVNQKEVLPSDATKKYPVARRHDVHFYPDDASFITGLTQFIEESLKAGKAVIVAATESHRDTLLQELQARGVDTATAIERGLYRALDADEIVAAFMVNDLPDPARLQTMAADLFATADKAGHGVAACGECAPLLWAQGKAEAAIQVEHLWDEIARRDNVDFLCGYVLSNFQRETQADICERICAEHSTVCCY